MKIIFYGLIFCFLHAQAVLAGELNPLLVSSVKNREVVVVKVISPELILLENNDKIKLIGIKGPKPPRFQDVVRDANGFIVPDTNPTTPFDLEALRFAQSLAEGKTVTLEFDLERRDAGGLRQAYVFLSDGKLLNAELVRFGFADLKLVPPNMKYADKLRLAYQEARREMRGMQGEW